MNPEQVLSRNTEILVDPSNSNNPIDSVGEIHNQILDAVAFDEDFETLDISEFCLDYVVSELGWNALDTIFSVSAIDSIVQVIWDYSLEEDFEGRISEMSTALSFSQTLTNHLNSLFGLLDYERESVPIANLIDSIIVKEQQFATAIVTPSESMIYYGTASILRYSAAYWDAVLEDETSTHPYYNVVVEYLMELDDELSNGSDVDVRKWNWKKFWRGLAVIGADALGFGAGYAIGSALSGGVPAVGASAGTLLGSAASTAVGEAWEIP